MAEVVHRNLESMLPQLEELESSGIFSHEEIKLIVKRRRNHEYKLLRRPARKEDFLAAVQYEMNLDQLRQHRKKKLGIGSTKQDADFGIQNRIHSLYKRALKKFKVDLKLWLQYLEFSKQSGHHVSLSRTYGRALAIHPNKPGLWVSAAKFEFDDMKDISSARALLQQGLRANPLSKHLWTECFRMELLHTDKVKKRREVLGMDLGDTDEPLSDDFLSNKAASLVYKEAVTKIPNDVEFRLSFLPIYRLFSETSARQDEVYKDVLESFPSHPLVWQARALRNWEGLDKTLTESIISELETKTELIFKEGISKAEGSEAQHWDNYIQWCQERVKSINLSDNLRKKAVKRMLTAFKESSKKGHLSAVKFHQYIDTLYKLGLIEEAAVASQQATTAHQESVSLWLQRLDCSPENALQLCREALRIIVTKESLPLWQWLVDHVLSVGVSEEEVKAVFLEAIHCGDSKITQTMTEQYLDWSYKTHSPDQTRANYKNLLCENSPASLFMYEQAIRLEKRLVVDSSSSDLEQLRELYSSALREHGATNIALWLGCIGLEITMPGGQVEQVARLHWRAIKELKPELVENFIAEYTLMS